MSGTLVRVIDCQMGLLVVKSTERTCFLQLQQSTTGSFKAAKKLSGFQMRSVPVSIEIEKQMLPTVGILARLAHGEGVAH
jgi:hypothetical protein